MSTDWASDVFGVMQAESITVVGTVPDAGLTKLLDLCHAAADMRVVTFASEEEGVGMNVGLWLGGQRGLLAMQSSGTGNCINALALPAATGTPCLMLVTMRGQAEEANPWQVPMGSAVPAVFEAMGVVTFSAGKAEEVGPMFAEAARLAFAEGKSAAVLVEQKVIGGKAFE